MPSLLLKTISFVNYILAQNTRFKFKGIKHLKALYNKDNTSNTLKKSLNICLALK